ncbi:hypothetical protein COO60DRAFT_696937 [Scenedesmus sp. NREL 46B-D3]|nr:hypothetical protein COO60DRAFT_696937 [Scenedesmus sp. NREL 46B-D3]
MLAPLMTCRKQLSRSSSVCCCATAVHDLAPPAPVDAPEDPSGALEQDLHSQTWRRKLQRCMCLLLWVLTKRIRTATSHGVVSCCRSWSRTTPLGGGGGFAGQPLPRGPSGRHCEAAGLAKCDCCGYRPATRVKQICRCLCYPCCVLAKHCPSITEQYLATNTGSCSAVPLCLHTNIVMPTSSMVTIAGFGNPLCHLHTMHCNKGTML